MHIAFVTNNKQNSLTKSDSLLTATLERVGHHIESIPWSSPNIHWNSFDAVVLRSCWDYFINPEKFLMWLDKLTFLRRNIWNPTSVIQWNLHKTYLMDLSKKNIRILPTQIVYKGSKLTLHTILAENNWKTAVVKPAIGAASSQVVKITQENVFLKEIWFRNMIKNSDILVQEYAPVIMDGEVSIIFFNKKYSHAVIKFPKKGDFRASPGYGSIIRPYVASRDVLRSTTHIVNQIKEPLLYARVDGIVYNGSFTLMELELIEPHLYIDTSNTAPGNFLTAWKEMGI